MFRNTRNTLFTVIALAAFFALVSPTTAGAQTITSRTQLVANTSGGWTVLGGDPLVPGGVHTKRDVQLLLLSTKGNTAMTYAGLSNGERATVRSWAGNDLHITPCTLHFGDHFLAMSFHVTGTFVDHNVTFADPRYRTTGAPAFCMTVPIRGSRYTHSLKIKIPQKCGNFGLVTRTSKVRRTGRVTLEKRVETGGKISIAPAGQFHFQATWKKTGVLHSKTFTNAHGFTLIANAVPTGNLVTVKEIKIPAGWTPVHKVESKRVPSGKNPLLRFVFTNRKPAPKPKTTTVTIVKKTVDSEGTQLTPTPGMFTFSVTDGSFNTTVTNQNPNRVVSGLPINTSATVCEIDVPSGWKITTPSSGNCFTVGLGTTGATFTFVNQKVPSPPKPTIQIILIQHVFTSGTDQICAIVGDSGSNPVGPSTVDFSANLGKTSSTFADPNGTAGKWCTNYTAPDNPTSDQDNTPDNCTRATCETVTVVLTDSGGNTLASDSMMFPVILETDSSKQ